MNVVHVIPSLAKNTGGPAINCVNLNVQLQNAGVRTAIVTTDALSPARSVDRAAGAGFADFPDGSEDLEIFIEPIRRVPALAYAPSMRDRLNSLVPNTDVVHVHSINLYPQLAAWRMASKWKLPMLLSPRGALDPWVQSQRKLQRRLNNMLWQDRMLRDVAMFHFTTDDERDLSGWGDRAPNTVIPNGLATGLVGFNPDPQRLKDELGLPQTTSLILNHGRLAEKKGLDRLIRALPDVRRRVPCELVLVGPDDEGYGSVLMRLAQEVEVGDYVHVLGPKYGNDLADAIAASSVWCLPSHGENFGMAVVEAMSLGRAVVISPHVNLATSAEVSGAARVTSNDPQRLADSLVNLLLDPVEAAALGERGREFVRQFSWDTLAPRYVQMYEQVVADWKSRR